MAPRRQHPDDRHEPWIRSTQRTLRSVLAVAFAAVPASAVGCGSSSGGSHNAGAPPAPAAATGAACELSVDCPAGTYCDLGACYQACNSIEAVCKPGLQCTERGRCASTATDPGDPPASSSSGLLSSATFTVTIAPNQTGFMLPLSGVGYVFYRLATSASWIEPPVERGAFQGATHIPIGVDLRAVPADATTARLDVFSTEGHVTVDVLTRPSIQQVWEGSVDFNTVHLPGAQPVEDVPLELGSMPLGLVVRADAPGLRAHVDPNYSPLWAATATGPAAGAGVDNQDGSFTFTLAEILDNVAANSLYPSVSPSVFGSASIGRQLILHVTPTPDGQMSGSAEERIYGLTSTPVDLVGTVSLRASQGATPDAFGIPAAVTMPAGPSRGAGPVPSGCTVPPMTDPIDSRWTDIAGASASPGLLGVGFPLDTFYAPAQTPTFQLNGLAAYTNAVMSCTQDLPQSAWRSLSQAGGTHDCIDVSSLECARYLSAADLQDSPPLTLQGGIDVARAYAEMFEMLGNDYAVQAETARLTGASPTDLRATVLNARVAYDAALFRMFQPTLFEELRAAPPIIAQDGPATVNDRIPLERAAESLSRSESATLQALQIDLANAPASTLQGPAKMDATLYWIEAALLADLDARWRGNAAVTTQVAGLAASLAAYTGMIAELGPGSTPLGYSSQYVPLLETTSMAPATQTNYERVFALAQTAVAASVQADQSAGKAARDFDSSAAAALAQLQSDAATQIATLLGLCGDSFVAGGIPNPDVSQCGSSTGQVAAALEAIQTAQLNVQSAQQALSSAYASYDAQSQAYATIHNANADEINFVNSSNQTIMNLTWAQSALQAASAVASAVGQAGSFSFTGAASVAGGALQAAADLVQPFIVAQQQAQQVEQLQVGAQITDVQNALALYQAGLQFAGLAAQIAIQVSQMNSAVTSFNTLVQQVNDATAAWNADQEAVARPIALDPSFRVTVDADVQAADSALLSARKSLYLAARALEYETNTDMSSITRQIFAAVNASQLSNLATCISGAWTQWQLLVSSPNTYTTEVSLAKDILGITGDTTDPQTGRVVSAGEQFRHYLFKQPYSPDGAHVWPAIQFGTSLSTSAPLFSALVCNDKVTGLEAKVVGKTLSGSGAELEVLVDGASTLRSCAATAAADKTVKWNLRPSGSLAPAVIEAGINAYPTAMPNASLNEYAVAQDTWIVTIPDAVASPANVGLAVDQIDDIVIRVTHSGIATSSATGGFAPTCN